MDYYYELAPISAILFKMHLFCFVLYCGGGGGGDVGGGGDESYSGTLREKCIECRI